MKKTILLFITAFLLMTAKAQNDIVKAPYNICSYDLDITQINTFEERSYVVSRIVEDPRFMITVGDEEGVFAVTSSPDYENIDFSSTFNEFLDDTRDEFSSLEKVDAAEIFFRDKSNMPEEFVTNLLMGTIRRDGNGLCSGALPFCTNAGLYEFPAGVNTGSGENGPCYNSGGWKGTTPCLSTTPNPAWYYMRMDEPGNINIYMFSTPSHDIDFICWGPFEDYLEPCPNSMGVTQLTCNKVVSCSYSSSATETCQIPATAQTGEYYILLITNYSNQACNITFSKQSGTGTTDCSILPPAIDHSNPCYGGRMQLTAQNVGNATYSWTGPDGFTSNIREPYIDNVDFDNSGTYSCSITVPGQGSSDPMTMEVEILPALNADFSNDDVCIGVEATFTGTESTTPPGHESAITERTWDFDDGSDPVHGSSATHTFDAAGTYEVTYTVIAENATGGTCEDVKIKTITVYDLPEADAGDNRNIYYGTSTELTTPAIEGATYAWTPVNMIEGNPNQQTVQTVALTAAQEYTVTVTSSHGCVNQDGVTIGVGEQMTASISCENSVICSDETTVLSASATGGTNTYTYSWTPANLVDDPTSASTTAHPTTTTIFYCDISDGVDVITKQLTINVNQVQYTPMNYEVCEQLLPYTITLPDGSIVELDQAYPESNPYQTIVYTEQGCKNHVSIVLNIAEMVSYTETIRRCNEGYDWIDNSDPTSPTYGQVVHHFDETGEKTIVFETEPCYTQITTRFFRDPEYTVPESYEGGVFYANEILADDPNFDACEPYTWSYVDPVTGKTFGNGETYKESADEEVRFITIHGCDSIVRFKFDRYYADEVPDDDARRVDTCMDADGFYIWGGKHCTQGDIVNGDIWSSNHFNFTTIHGCDSVAKIRLRLFDRPQVDNQISGIKKVEIGDGLMPSIYNYTVTGLHGAGIDSLYPPTYKWQLLTYYDTPNNIDGTCSWELSSSLTSSVAQIFVDNIPGNAILKCDIETRCGVVSTSLFIYTEGYEQGESVDEIDYNHLVEVYPNPTNGEIYIGYANEIIKSQITISIYNFSGQLIDTFKGDTQNNVTTYSMDGFSNGLYLMKISGKDFSVMRKVVVNR